MTAGTTFRLKRLYRLCPEERSRIQEQLTDERFRHPDVLFAYLYGSFVDAEAFHDVDIGATYQPARPTATLPLICRPT